MVESPYVSEDDFQALLEKYPDLLVSRQIDTISPRRWLLVQREMVIPDSESSIGRWSVDHLFLDQDAIPTLVEVKRSSDTRIRREVVGQMLDYAANAAIYCSAEEIRECYEATCNRKGIDAERALMLCVGDELDSVEAYWQRLKTNLKIGNIRMLFVADHIPPELKRIVEFLNEQMTPAEVLAVEIKQYVGDGLKTLVPRVIGQTTEAQTNKRGLAAPPRQWDEASFLQALANHNGSTEVSVAQQILEWTKRHQLNIKWGKGAKWGTFTPLFSIEGIQYSEGIQYPLFRAWSVDGLEIYPEPLRKRSLFQKTERFNELLTKLYSIDGIEPHKQYPKESFTRIRYTDLSKGALPDFLHFYDWVIEELRVGSDVALV